MIRGMRTGYGLRKKTIIVLPGDCASSPRPRNGRGENLRTVTPRRDGDLKNKKGERKCQNLRNRMISKLNLRYIAQIISIDPLLNEREDGREEGAE